MAIGNFLCAPPYIYPPIELDTDCYVDDPQGFQNATLGCGTNFPYSPPYASDEYGTSTTWAALSYDSVPADSHFSNSNFSSSSGVSPMSKTSSCSTFSEASAADDTLSPTDARLYQAFPQPLQRPVAPACPSVSVFDVDLDVDFDVDFDVAYVPARLPEYYSSDAVHEKTARWSSMAAKFHRGSFYNSCHGSVLDDRGAELAISERPPAYSPEALPAYKPRAATTTTTDAPKKYHCGRLECAHLAFSRQADLQRHKLHVHGCPAYKKHFHCDYVDCNRYKNPHHRKDHFRDHLRDVHHEDLIKHGSNAHGPSPTASLLPSATPAPATVLLNKQQMERLWLRSLPTDLTWWRCPKCLERVKVADQGYKCCKTDIEPIRLEVRKAMQKESGI